MMSHVFTRGPPGALDIPQTQHPAIILPSEADAPQHRVGFTDLGEAARGLIAARVPVRMVAEALSVVRGLDLRLRGARGNAQDVVIRRFTGVKGSVSVGAVRSELLFRHAQEKSAGRLEILLSAVMSFIITFLQYP